jgi:hypothetical protein
MKSWPIILKLVLLVASPALADDVEQEWHAGDPYDVSLSGEIRIHVKYQDDCKQTNPDVMDGIFVAAEEVVTIAQPRRMLNRIDNPDIIIDNREPYRDYIVTLEYLKEGYVMQKIRLPAYNSPPKINFEFDCKNVKNEMWDVRRARSAERDKKKAKKEADAKVKKQTNAEESKQPEGAKEVSAKTDKAAAPSH